MPLKPLKGLDDIKENEREHILMLYDNISKSKHIENGFLLPGFQVPGAQVKDCDIILCIDFSSHNPPLIQYSDQKFEFHNLLFLIELKTHNKFSVEQGSIYVKYSGKDKDALIQIKNLTGNLKMYFERYKEIFKYKQTPWIYNAIYFPNINKDRLSKDNLALPVIEINLLFGKQIYLKDLLELAVKQNYLQYAQKKKEKNLLSSWIVDSIENKQKSFRGICDALSMIEGRHLGLTALDRRRVEIITKQRIDTTSRYIENLGQQLLIFKGKAGTGKTMRLLNLSSHLSRSGCSYVLITFNHALKADLIRLCTILKQNDIYKKFDINIETINKLTSDMANIIEPGATKKYENDFDKQLDYNLEIVANALEGEDKHLWRDGILEEIPGLNVDFILIDEGQDWQEKEQKIIKSIAGNPEHLIIAIGPDQNTRGYSSNDWDLYPRRQVIPCSKNIRQTNIIHSFNTIFSRDFISDDWTEPNDVSIGRGYLQIMPDSELLKESFWSDLEKELNNTLNAPIDVLIIEPKRLFGNQSCSEILGNFKKICWNGAETSIRRSVIPLHSSEYRIVTYESSRGLESWISIVRLIDIQYSEYFKRFKKKKLQTQLFEPTVEELNHDVYTQLRIALTRSIDRLYITYSDQNSLPIKDLIKIKSFVDNQPQ